MSAGRRDHENPEVVPASSVDALPADLDDAPPVVARLVVEIRSDGTRTIARGAMEDLVRDERVALEATAGSPVELAASLTKLLLSTPLMATRALRDASPRPARGGVRRLAAGVADRILGRVVGRRDDD
jgi:hypothetical protein